MSEVPAPAPTPTPAPTPAPAPTLSGGDWTTGLSDEMRGYVQTKGFKDPSAVLESYRNFEKTMGAPAEHLLKLPENMETPEGRAIWERLGAPKEAKDYKIELPGGDENFLNGLREIAHKNAFTHKQMESFLGFFKGHQESSQKAMDDVVQTKMTDAQNNLKKEWGSAFEQNSNLADAGALKLGMGEKEVQALGAALGADKAMMLLHKLGTATGEASFVSGQPAGSDMMTPGAAQAEIQALKSDASFAKRFTSGEADAVRKWNRLNEQAYGVALR